MRVGVRGLWDRVSRVRESRVRVRMRVLYLAKAGIQLVAYIATTNTMM